jgi:hypothetical protein
LTRRAADRHGAFFARRALWQVSARQGKAAEQAARIAGVLAIVEEPTASEIQALTTKNALGLVTWHLSERFGWPRRRASAPGSGMRTSFSIGCNERAGGRSLCEKCGS